MRVNILDTQFAHGTSLGSGDLPLYPKHFTWTRKGDGDTEYVFITESCFHIMQSVSKEKRIAFLIEPMSINSESYRFVQNNKDEFYGVLSHNKKFLEGLSGKGMYYAFGGCWIKLEDRKLRPKTKLISIIASGKKETAGHRLRHEVIEQFKGQIDVYGRGYNPIEDKLDALRDYMYSIVIENEQSKGWFTEKLIDCFQTGTIPIYWGAPDIYDYFEQQRGCFNLEFLDKLFAAERSDPGAMRRYYQEDLLRVHKMFELSQKYVCPEDYIYENYPFLFTVKN